MWPIDPSCFELGVYSSVAEILADFNLVAAQADHQTAKFSIYTVAKFIYSKLWAKVV